MSFFSLDKLWQWSCLLGVPTASLTLHCWSTLTWVEAERALDGPAPHAGDCAGDSVHVGEELHGTQWVLWDGAILRQVVVSVALRQRYT